jgi:hypothetical protein
MHFAVELLDQKKCSTNVCWKASDSQLPTAVQSAALVQVMPSSELMRPNAGLGLATVDHAPPSQ